MRVILPLLFFGVVAGSCLVGAAGKLPAFKVERWVNSPPLTAEALRGKVVLLDIWEYTCINWIRTSPYVKAWHRDYAALGLVVVGLHAPEFEFGKRADNIDRGIRDHGLTYPIALDNDFATWRALGNDAWPAKYLYRRPGKTGEAMGGRGALRRNRGRRSGASWWRQSRARNCPRPARGDGVCEDRPAFLRRDHQRDVRRLRAARAGHDHSGRRLAQRAPVRRTPEGHRQDHPAVHGRRGESGHATGTIGEARRSPCCSTGKPVGEARGADVGADGVARFDRSGMFRLVAGASRGRHVLTLVASDPGLRAFVFTFGP